MSQFYDTYLECTDKTTLEQFLTSFSDKIGVTQGRAAQPETTDVDGVVTPEQPALGDPANYYVCVRTQCRIVPDEPIVVTEDASIAQLVGVFA